MLIAAFFPQRGVTLIEALIGMALLAIVMSIAVPSFTVWIQNGQIRAVSESISGGLQLARAEAIRRNTSIQFLLTNDDPSNIAASANTNGKNWIVRPATGGTPIVSYSSSGEATNLAIAGGAVTFNSFGRTTLGADLAINVSSPHGSRPLRVQVSTLGQVRLCDPGLTNHPQAC